MLVDAALSNKLVVPDFEGFCAEMQDLFDKCCDYKHPPGQAANDGVGENAQYIPQLALVDPTKKAVAVCTIDGQRWAVGDYEDFFCIQSCSKPLTYCMALQARPPQHSHICRHKNPIYMYRGPPFAFF